MKKALYVEVAPAVHLAARQRALADGKTLSKLVEEALRALLGLTEVAS